MIRRLVVLVLATWLSADALAEPHPLIERKVYFQGGTFFTRPDIDIRVDGDAGEIGTTVDVEAVLGLSARDEMFAGELWWRFTDQWRVAMQYFKFNERAASVLELDIEFEGLEFLAGNILSAGTKLNVTRLFVGRDLLRNERQVFGVGLGVHLLDLSASVTGEARVEGENVGRTAAGGSADAPLPNIGAWYTWAPNDRWAVTSRLDWLSASIDPYDGTIVNASAGFNYRITKNIGAGINYNVFTLNVNMSDSGWSGKADIKLHGPYAYVSAYW